MACPYGDRYRGLRGGTVASLHASIMLEREGQIERCTLARQRTRYKAARDECKGCKALGISGRGCHPIARE